MKRLFIENDENVDFTNVARYLNKFYNFTGDPNDFFDEIITEATYNSQEAWQSIKRNDEIFAESSLIDMMGISGGLLFNNMMYMAIVENVTDKKVYFFSSKNEIWWENLNAKLFDQAFTKNEMYTAEGNNWVKVSVNDVSKNMG